MPCLIFIVWCFFGGIAHAQWNQLSNSILGNAVDDACGTAVAINDSGSVIAVGTPYHDFSANNAGLVQAYSLDNGNWLPYGNAIYGTGSNHRSGSAIALNKSGTVLAIGAPYNGTNGSQSGKVGVYQYNNGWWTQLGTDLLGEAALDQSGASLSLSENGQIVAIAARFNNGNGANAGHVRVFQYLGGIWTQLGTDIDGEMAGDQFGASLGLSADGTILAVGAPFNAGNGAQSGQVRVFELVNSNWTQKGSDIDGEWAGEQSGKSVDLSADGTRIVVGAILNDDAGSNAGQVRIFDFQTGSWQQLGNDINGDAAENELGTSVAINGDGTVVALGAKFKDGFLADIGQVRVLRYDSTDWQLIDAPIEGLMSGENSGASLGLSAEGGTFIVGAPQYNAVRGVARVYQNSSYLPTDLVAAESSAVSCQKLAAGQYRLVFPMMKDYDLRIYDRYGRLHYSKSLTNKGTYILDRSLVSRGIFFVQVLSNEDQWTGKLLFP